MLGRTADSLYWMTRYIERAENTARLLDVGQRMTLISATEDSVRSTWHSTLEVSGSLESFEERYDELTEANVVSFLALDHESAESMWSSIRAARENARSLRGSITTEMWESLNATWLDIRDLGPNDVTPTGYRGLFDRVKERAHLFRGVTLGTMLRDNAFDFMQLGWALERANNTARLLDSKYHVLLPDSQEVGGAIDYYQWGALLRSVSAFRAYHRVYTGEITPSHVAELLITNENLPRSLDACIGNVTAALDGLCGRQSYECRRLAGELHARVAYASIDEVFEHGLHEFLTEFIDDNAALGRSIQTDFMMLA